MPSPKRQRTIKGNGSLTCPGPTRAMGTFIEELFEAEFCVTKLARISGRSERQFARDFRERFHCCPRVMVREIRMKLAREWLRSNARVKEIAIELGYSNQTDFSRAFKAYYGTNPLKMRQVLLEKVHGTIAVPGVAKKMSQNA